MEATPTAVKDAIEKTIESNNQKQESKLLMALEEINKSIALLKTTEGESKHPGKSPPKKQEGLEPDTEGDPLPGLLTRFSGTLIMRFAASQSDSACLVFRVTSEGIRMVIPKTTSLGEIFNGLLFILLRKQKLLNCNIVD